MSFSVLRPSVLRVLHCPVCSPDELYNRYEDPAYEQVRKELAQKLTDFHPPLAEDIDEMSPIVFIEQDEYSFTPGDHLAPEEAPYQRGKALTITATLSPNGSNWPSAPILDTNIGQVHGYALFLDERSTRVSGSASGFVAGGRIRSFCLQIGSPPER